MHLSQEEVDEIFFSPDTYKRTWKDHLLIGGGTLLIAATVFFGCFALMGGL